MLKQAGTRLWVCASCVRHAALATSSSVRSFSVSAARDFLQQPHPNPVDRSAPGQAQDDTILRQLFDYPTATKSQTASGQQTGLFKNRYLTRPQGFLAFANRTIEKAERIVDRVLWASTQDEYRSVVRHLDRLSDLLCRVLDLSDFVRMTHPDGRFQEAASAAWALTYQYMNRLNTMAGLSDQLRKALEDPAVRSSWSEEELAVARILHLDFVKSAIHLPTAQRDRFVWLSQRISEVGTAFCADMSPQQPLVSAPSAEFFGLDPRVAASVTTSNGMVRLPSVGAEASAALRGVHSEETRRQVYLASRTASKLTVTRLEEMLALRAELAKLAGFESYAHMALEGRMMARSPASVLEFLLALRSHNAPVARAEVGALQAKKREHLADETAVLQAWDRDYYTDLVRQDMRTGVRGDDELADFFSVGTVMQGLSRLFSRLYGIRLVPRASQPGETWHPDVHRLDVVADSGDVVAVLYCDLFARAAKSPNPTHFTVRCSRDISHEELEDAALEMSSSSSSSSSSDPQLPRFDTPQQAANDGMETSTESGTLKQLPTIALVCDFVPSHSRLVPPLLTLRQVETLFHEMGHAAHSILARTSLHNVSGTRCANDLAELPSTLLEHFATNPAVLSLFARHWRTGARLPYERVADRARLSSRFGGMRTEYQILLALVDQAFHAAPPPSGARLDSTALYHSMQRRYATPPIEDPSTRWQGFFGHLHGYGSHYYSYLFDRVLADRVWEVVFNRGAGEAAIDRANGETLKESLLKWGGSRDPWACLSAALGDDRLASGDEKAMALVGSWGIKEHPHK